MTLSETINYLIDEIENKQLYGEQIEKMRANLKALLQSK